MGLKDSRIVERFAVILAGGDGSRLKSLTRMISGDDRPKQFCRIWNGETLLEATRKRVSLRVRPRHIFLSLTARHARFFTPELSKLAKEQLIVQPENKGTGPAILFSLLRLAKISPGADVAFFPSDHYFSDDAGFMDQVDRAFMAIGHDPHSIVLLGIQPDAPETSYGWIEAHGSGMTNTDNNLPRRVRKFWEKPSKFAAERFLEKGFLWNSFVMIGKVGTFLELISSHVPDLYQIFEASADRLGTDKEEDTVRWLYRRLNEINFSREVLAKATSRLLVLPIKDVSWSDWGEPQRVLTTLRSLGVRTNWMPLVSGSEIGHRV